MNEPKTPALDVATLGGGCFWCLEAVFENIKGVQKVVSGYAGGKNDNPTYEQVCSGSTGHAEVVQITFDPNVVSFDDLLAVFFTIHDPTTLNRQGNDVGTQYRSVIYYHSADQRQSADKIIAELRSVKAHPVAVVTEVAPAPTFYSAEEYHQGYFRQHPGQGYCQYVVAPKVDKLRKRFAAMVAP